MLKRTLHIIGRTLLVICLLLLVAYALLHHPRVQTWLVHKATSSLSKKLGARVHIESVDIDLFHSFVLKKIIIEDKQGDTLLWAGHANIDITDWFFFKKDAMLHRVAIADGFVHLHRTDSIWNHQFIIDHLSTSDKKTTSKQGTQFGLNKIECKNIRFIMDDEWIGERWSVQAARFYAEINQVDFTHNKLAIRSIEATDPIITQQLFAGKKKVNQTAHSPSINSKQPSWSVTLQQCTITNGGFQYDLQTTAALNGNRFDGNHFQFYNISATCHNLRFENNQLYAIVNVQSAHEKHGLDIKKIHALCSLTDTSLVFDQLDLNFNDSHIDDHFSMQFRDWQEDMRSFESRVYLHARFKKADVSSKDLAYFFPGMEKNNVRIQLQSTIEGTLDNLSCQNLRLASGRTSLRGNLRIQHLPDFQQAMINLSVEESQIAYSDLCILAPSLRSIKSVNLASMGVLGYRGRFDGFPRDFIAKGIFTSNLGIVETDLQCTLPVNGNPVYKGNVLTNRFQLGTFLNDRRIGHVALSGNIQVEKNELSEPITQFNGSIRELSWNDYTYQQIEVSGTFGKNRFSGKADISDPNLMVTELSGSINFENNQNAYNLSANIEHADLEKLGIMNTPLQLSTSLQFNFIGNHIDNFLGSAKLTDLRLQNKTQQIFTDSLVISSEITDIGKKLTVYNNEIGAQVSGDFKILELPDAFRHFLNKYYPLYVEKTTSRLSPQQFSFGIVTKNIEDYLRFFQTPLQGGNDVNITGYLDLTTKSPQATDPLSNFALNGNIPYIRYENTSASEIRFSTDNEFDTLITNIQFSDLHIDDTTFFTNTHVGIKSHNDNHDIKLSTAYKNTENRASLHGNIHTHPEGIDILFKPSSFTLNNKEWRLEKDGSVKIRKAFVDVTDIQFTNEEQSIRLKSEDDSETGKMNLVLALKNINISDLSAITGPSLQADGTLNGKALIKNITDRPVVEASVDIDSLQINNRRIGNTRIEGSYAIESKTGTVQANTDDAVNQLSIDGAFNFSDTATQTMQLQLLTKSVQLDLLEPYLKGVFSQINGVASGQLQYIQHKDETPVFIGTMTLDSALLKVDYTQVAYRAQHQVIRLEKDRIVLQAIQLKDSLQNSMSLNGTIRHKAFNGIFLDNLKVESSKIALLNTTRSDNPYFWGQINGQVQTTINGPVNDFKIDIKGEPNRVDTSHIYLNTDYSGESRSFDYIYFRSPGENTQTPPKQTTASNISVSLNITANPACKVDVILDEETKDIIKGTGTGEIKINTGTKQPMTISGIYNLSKGEYTFNFQTFFKKPFTLLQGGVIRWDKNPDDAFIDIKAEYTAGGVDISSLSTSSGVNRREDIRIISSLRGSLKNPEIHFTFELPEKSENRRDDLLVKRLADFQNDENEMNKQVASLLLFNTFILGDQNLFTQGTASNLITRSIGGMMSNLLTGFLNRELNRATKGILSTYIDISPTLDLQRNVSQVQANVKAGLKILLSNRLEVLVGGQLDYNNPALAQFLDRRGLITPDINVEWIINRDGSLRVIGFNRSSIDISMNQRNRSGLQLSYRKEANRFSDIFRRRKKGDPD